MNLENTSIVLSSSTFLSRLRFGSLLQSPLPVLRCLFGGVILFSLLLDPLGVHASGSNLRTPPIDAEDRDANKDRDREQHPCRVRDAKVLVHWAGVEGANTSEDVSSKSITTGG